MVNKTTAGAGDPWGIRPMLLALGGVVLYVLLSGVCLLGVAFVPLPFRLARETATLAVVLLVVSVASVLLTVTVLVVTVRRSRHLDGAFAPLGLPGRIFRVSGRQYHGEYGRRRLDAYFAMRRAPDHDIYLSTPLQTRAFFGRPTLLSRAMLGLFNKAPQMFADPELAHLSYTALDEPWLHALLADPRARASALRLTAAMPPAAGAWAAMRVSLAPEAWQLSPFGMNFSQVTPENLKAWLSDLQTLAEVAEALPPPQVTATEAGLERSYRLNRLAALQGLDMAVTVMAVVIGLGLVGFFCFASALLALMSFG